ncbi:protein FAR-RED IMPAIRED RESPONSE 1-like [Carya illinoinensis]|uniref:protein FAR-RED IMPAIRED RESPONSE 1-like n=1 Tax=Carya illinoinensis TaxID=32201 RepID=UPI001C72620B|nr:protein FAR-RED IMPAIRED RESPONSE 1-like [Carya illinoinensis]
MGTPRPFMSTSAATSARFAEEDRPNTFETEAPCTSAARVDEEILLDRPVETITEPVSPGTPHVVTSSDGDDIFEEPKSGMEFNSFEDLLSYYKQYAKRCGFGVMTQRSERSNDHGVRYVTLGCARGGKAQIKSSNPANPRPTGKTDCKARINALRIEGKMRLTTVNNTHNHVISPQKSRFFRCNRAVSETVKSVLDTNNLAGIRMNKSYGSLVVGAGGFENLPFLEKDCRNYIDKARHLRLGAASKAIITDQDRAMKNAIAIVFPESRHRFCLWHILKKVLEKFGSYATYRSGLKIELMKCVYNTQTIQEFENCWAGFINTYDLHENAWLTSLYNEREHWVPVFLKEHFWAGMSTTQRSESMNAFFDGYIHAKTNLKEFVDQFDNALKKKIENENQAEFQSFNGTIPCISRSPIEKKFQSLYTNAKFKEVQQQVIGMLDLEIKLHRSDGVTSTYVLEDEVRIQEFTKQYILDRWRKDIKRRYTSIRSSYDAGDQRPNGNRHTILLNMCYEMIDYAVDSNEQFEDAKKRINEMTGLYRQYQCPLSMAETGSEPVFTTQDTAVGSSQQVKSPRIVRGKGRPPSLRRASRMEIDMWKVKAKQAKQQVGGKRKQRDERETSSMGTCMNLFHDGDIAALDTRKNLFGPSEVDICVNPGQVQGVRDSSPFNSSGPTQSHPIIDSQESIFYDWMAHNQNSLGGDGSQE